MLGPIWVPSRSPEEEWSCVLGPNWVPSRSPDVPPDEGDAGGSDEGDEGRQPPAVQGCHPQGGGLHLPGEALQHEGGVQGQGPARPQLPLSQGQGTTYTSCRSESSFSELGRLDKSLLCPSLM